jgi:hypothetical protein
MISPEEHCPRGLIETSGLVPDTVMAEPYPAGTANIFLREMVAFPGACPAEGVAANKPALLFEERAIILIKLDDFQREFLFVP